MGKRLLIPFLMLILAAGSSYAQLCQGSLGDPIVNITFGAGANPGPPITAAATSYQYRSGDCPDDGYYSVRNRTDQCFGQSWFNVPSDHTGDPNGYFMLVNASFQPGAFYLDTVRGLCASTTYEFAAWIMNVIMPSSCGGNSIRPDLTFSIEQTDGTILKTYNTGSIATSQSPTWNQYGSFFTTPAGVTDVVLRITKGVAQRYVDAGFRWGQVGGASLISLSHGTNDAQKTMGVITLALIASGHWHTTDAIPTLVKVACALAIASGTYIGGWRIIRTLGKGLVDISPAQGMAADTSSAAVILAFCN